MNSFGLVEGAALAELERALALLEPLIARTDVSEYARERLRVLGMDLFRSIRSIADVTRLEQGALAEVGRDFALVEAQVDALAGLGPEGYVATEPQYPALVESFARAKTLLSTTKTQMADIEPLEIGLRLELVVDRVLTRALGLLRPQSVVGKQVLEAVARKLTLVSDEECLRLWAKISAEVQPSSDPWSARIPIDPVVVDRAFFLLGGSKPLRELIAQYLIEVRPRLVESASRAGQPSFPFPPIAIAQILSWTKSSLTLSAKEERLAGHIMLLAYLLSTRMDVDRNELAGLLGLPASARILNGQAERKAKKLVPEAAATLVVFSECKSVVNLLSIVGRATREPEIELLIRYKLSAEVGLPTSRARFAGQNEVALQRALSAFLIEHGCFAVGTKFGPAETDLVMGSAVDPLVVEVKLFSERPSPSAIKRAFVQVLSYMDQAPYKSRGALVLFNLSEVPIIVPKEFVSRVAFIAVNLPQKTPSGRVAAVEVRAGQSGNQLLEVLSVGWPEGDMGKATSRRASKKKAKR